MRLPRTCQTIFLTQILLLIPLLASAASFSGKVIKISDGDTIQILCQGKPQTIRLAEIDCPEEKGQPFGKKAKQFTASLAAGKTVTVEPKTKDRYGRTVGEVFLPDNRSLNRELVKSGYAWWYRKYSDDISLGILEAEASKAHKGLWQDPNPSPPWEWRKAEITHGKDKKQQPQTTAAGPFHGNVKSRVFHKPGCRYYNCKNCKKIFKVREKAIKAGFKPCGICRP